MSAGRTGHAYIGISGYDYAPWRLHGSRELYASGYTDAELDDWAAKVAGWRDAPNGGRDVYVYFDDDIETHAPFDAACLAERLGVAPLAGMGEVAEAVSSACPTSAGRTAG